mmetsp:Transcript_45804/g.72720  ORF Transcript_45804/g.72720 Transcript_45804/m.72720 type:complete len:266 (-) Transcript_45804:372-1169(-)
MPLKRSSSEKKAAIADPIFSPVATRSGPTAVTTSLIILPMSENIFAIGSKALMAPGKTAPPANLVTLSEKPSPASINFFMICERKPKNHSLPALAAPTTKFPTFSAASWTQSTVASVNFSMSWTARTVFLTADFAAASVQSAASSKKFSSWPAPVLRKTLNSSPFFLTSATPALARATGSGTFTGRFTSTGGSSIFGSIQTSIFGGLKLQQNPAAIRWLSEAFFSTRFAWPSAPLCRVLFTFTFGLLFFRAVRAVSRFKAPISLV